MPFCSNCGNKVEPGMKFCPNCGQPLMNQQIQSSNAQSNPYMVTAGDNNIQDSNQNQLNHSERTQEFAGTILKCPNCGAPIGQTTAVCPECGYHITGTEAVSSVKRFTEELMRLQSQKKDKGFWGMINIYAPADKVDKQILSLIRNYPIPNTVDDIREFMVLAISNIDTTQSRFFRKMGSNPVMALEMPQAISNAWASKLEQAYQKAKLSFPNDPAFAEIKRMYVEEMEELKVKPKD